MALPLVQTHAFKRLNAHSDDSAQVELDGRIQSLDTAAQSLLTRLNAKGVWHDHSTQTVFASNTPTVMLPWAFKPHYWHWLQAAWIKP
jgi:hypothetical protein